MKIRKINEKRGLSEMISYVLLVAIAIGISIGVFVWLKSFSNVNPVADCEEGTSVIIDSYDCRCVSTGCFISLAIKNNGRFNVSGIILTVSNDSKEPTYYLIQQLDSKKLFQGFQFFSPPLDPGSMAYANFSNTLKNGNNLTNIASVQIQPVIYNKKTRIVCQNSIIKQAIQDCNFVPI